MKSASKFLVITVLGLAFSAFTFAQVTETATATATIVGPISLTLVDDMNFGNVAVGASGGTVVLTPAGGRSTTGGVTLPAITGTVTAAEFTVAGADGYTYAITLPVGATTITSGANTMTVDTWTSTPAATGTLTGGSETLTVGATLNVAALQPAGTYISGTAFAVTVNYN
jgi:hypothetical protein